MYILYQYGDEIDSYETIEAVQAEVDSLRKDYAIDEQYDMDKWPQDFTPGYVAGDSFDEYFRDVYRIYQDIEPGQFLRG